MTWHFLVFPIYFWTVFDKVQKGGGSARKCELRNSRAKPGKRASTRIHTQTRRDVTVVTFHRVHSSREKHGETPHVTFSTIICAIVHKSLGKKDRRWQVWRCQVRTLQMSAHSHPDTFTQKVSKLSGKCESKGIKCRRRRERANWQKMGGEGERPPFRDTCAERRRDDDAKKNFDVDKGALSRRNRSWIPIVSRSKGLPGNRRVNKINLVLGHIVDRLLGICISLVVSKLFRFLVNTRDRDNRSVPPASSYQFNRSATRTW